MADRELLLSHVLTKGLRGFEIGALTSPFLPVADNDVTIVDRLSTLELQTKFAAEPGVAIHDIVEVDVIVSDGDLVLAME